MWQFSRGPVKYIGFHRNQNVLIPLRWPGEQFPSHFAIGGGLCEFSQYGMYRDYQYQEHLLQEQASPEQYFLRQFSTCPVPAVWEGNP